MAGYFGNTDKKNWNTPERLLKPVRRFLGEIDLDPATNPLSTVGAKTNYIWPQNDGLTDPWLPFPTIFVNPPYGALYYHKKARICLGPKEYKALKEAEPAEAKNYVRRTIKDWIYRCHSVALYGAEVVACIPAAVETSHWHDYIWPFAKAICFVQGRVAFLDGDTGKPGKNINVSGTALVYWGHRADEFREFLAPVGHVIKL